MKETRDSVYSAIDEERNYQSIHTLQDDPSSPNFTTGDYITMMAHYVNQLPTEWATAPGAAPPGVLANMRKIAAIAVQCMEVHGVVRRSEEGRGVWGDRSSEEK